MEGSGGRGLKQTHVFFQRLRLKRALGIKWRGSLCSGKRMRGRDRCKGTWWDKKLNRIAIEDQDFAQDTQEGGADQFELIPDSDDEALPHVSTVLAGDDEFVPKTEPQDVSTIKHIGKQGVTKTHGCLGTMLHQWLQILESDRDGTTHIATSKENTSTKHTESSEEKDHDKKNKEHKASFSDVETDDEATPISVFEARGFLVPCLVEDDSNQRDGKYYELLHYQRDQLLRSMPKRPLLWDGGSN